MYGILWQVIMAGSGVIVRGVFDKPLVQMIKEFGQGGNIGCSDT